MALDEFIRRFYDDDEETEPASPSTPAHFSSGQD